MVIGLDIDGTVIENGKATDHCERFLIMCKGSVVHFITHRNWSSHRNTERQLNEIGFRDKYNAIHFFNKDYCKDLEILEEDGKCKLWSQFIDNYHAKAFLGLKLKLNEYYDDDPDNLYMFMKKETDPDIGTNCFIVYPTSIVEYDERILY